MECAGAYAVFDGINSPATQTFGLGLFEELPPASLDRIERFFLDRAAPVLHEVSPLVGVATLGLLCARQYKPFEISSVLYQQLEPPVTKDDPAVTVRIVGLDEAPLWSKVSAQGWAPEHPELLESLQQFGALAAARTHSVSFLAELQGQPGAAGVLCLHEGVALFGGASTIPELRHHGLQSALLQARIRYALDHGYELAMMVTEAGSQSQRNAERKGFRVAYTRTKWRLSRVGDER